MAAYRVVVSDQVFPSVDLERQLLSDIDASLEVASGALHVTLMLWQRADARDADEISELFEKTLLILGDKTIRSLRHGRGVLSL